MIDRQRRMLLQAGAVACGSFALPLSARAAGKVVATTYPGSFEEAYRAVLLPQYQKQSGSSVVLTPLLGVDQVAKIAASRGNPPYDAVMFDEGPLYNAIKAGIIQKFPADKSKHFADLPPVFQGTAGLGPVVTVQVCGIAYNPKKIKTPPTSWADLWRPEYKGRVGMTGIGSSLGAGFLAEISKMKGGSEKNAEPGFAMLRELVPNIGALAPSPGALAALFQQGQIDIAPNYFNNVETLRSKGVDIAFAMPATGGIMIRTSMHIVAGTAEPQAALEYIDALISPEVQRGLEKAPYNMVPTNGKVAYTGETARQIAKDFQDLSKKLVLNDWAAIQEQRPAWIERFNKEVKL